MSLREEESLFSGLRRQVDQARERHREQISGLEVDKERLLAELAVLKREAYETRLSNQNALEEQQRTLAVTARLEADLEALQVAYSGAVDDREHFQAGEAMAADEAQQLGPLRRALFFKDNQICELKEEVCRADLSKKAAVQAEWAVSAGLRERIGHLERRIRDKSDDERARSSSGETEHELAVTREKLERARRESQDARDALSKEVRASTRERRRAETAEDALRDAREQVCHDREVEVERDRLRLQLAAIEQENGSKTPGALQPMPFNASTKDAGSICVSSPSKQNARLQRELAHIQSQHATLKAAHDKLRVDYAHLSAKRDKDRQHFKDFHAVYMARKQAKRKRREAGAAPPSEESAITRLTPPGPSSSALGKSSPAGQDGDDGVEPPAKRVRPSPPRALEKTVTAPGLGSPPRPRPGRSVSPLPDLASGLPAISAAAPELAQSKPSLVSAPIPKPRVSSTSAQASTPVISRTVGVSTPAARPGASMSTPVISMRTPAVLTRQASRVTPWLGGKAGAQLRSTSTSSRRLARRDSFESDDEVPSPAPSRHLLVRDRTGTSTMLRKEALKRFIEGQGDSLRVDSPKRTDSISSKLDFEGLNPAERAAERKRLASLSTAERRQIYAPYKGKGRYVAPDDLKTTFADEFEIDPARNEGVAHQYDAVVRNRDERKRMHGGDCECCRDYYAAVGDIPRFHGAPAWRDETADERAVDIEDHQNRVSRHREIWRRPPTPPDYWKIPFPTTQEVESVNRRADVMTAAREAEVRREAAHKDSKWRKRT